MFAPALRSALIASTRFIDAANINGVWPKVFSLASISAPFSTSVVTACGLPDCAANINAVVPSAFAAFASAPPERSAAITVAWPWSAAIISGV